ncbi:hypothetical protein BJ742DRAFT_221127 [Cladochytrium replicatum]|nr:hypothetical protein BJ742DRAFT_221127 [Cladochytrium replicatum]
MWMREIRSCNEWAAAKWLGTIILRRLLLLIGAVVFPMRYFLQIAVHFVLQGYGLKLITGRRPQLRYVRTAAGLVVCFSVIALLTKSIGFRMESHHVKMAVGAAHLSDVVKCGWSPSSKFQEDFSKFQSEYQRYIKMQSEIMTSRFMSRDKKFRKLIEVDIANSSDISSKLVSFLSAVIIGVRHQRAVFLKGFVSLEELFDTGLRLRAPQSLELIIKTTERKDLIASKKQILAWKPEFGAPSDWETPKSIPGSVSVSVNSRFVYPIQFRTKTLSLQDKFHDWWLRGDLDNVATANIPIWRLESIKGAEYPVPLLLANPKYQKWFTERFPSLNILHGAAKTILKLKSNWEAAALKFALKRFAPGTIGIDGKAVRIQLRTRDPKCDTISVMRGLNVGVYVPGQLEQITKKSMAEALRHYAAALRMVVERKNMQRGYIRYIVVSKDPEFAPRLARLMGIPYISAYHEMPGVVQNLTNTNSLSQQIQENELKTAETQGVPIMVSRDSAYFYAASSRTVREANSVVEMRILSLCDELVSVQGNPFAEFTAAWGGIQAVKIIPSMSSSNEYNWMPTSEPCSMGLTGFYNRSSRVQRSLLRKDPLWAARSQCGM